MSALFHVTSIISDKVLSITSLKTAPKNSKIQLCSVVYPKLYLDVDKKILSTLTNYFFIVIGNKYENMEYDTWGPYFLLAEWTKARDLFFPLFFLVSWSNTKVYCLRLEWISTQILYRISLNNGFNVQCILTYFFLYRKWYILAVIRNINLSNEMKSSYLLKKYSHSR